MIKIISSTLFIKVTITYLIWIKLLLSDFYELYPQLKTSIDITTALYFYYVNIVLSFIDERKLIKRIPFMGMFVRFVSLYENFFIEYLTLYKI